MHLEAIRHKHDCRCRGLHVYYAMYAGGIDRRSKIDEKHNNHLAFDLEFSCILSRCDSAIIECNDCRLPNINDDSCMRMDMTVQMTLVGVKTGEYSPNADQICV